MKGYDGGVGVVPNEQGESDDLFASKSWIQWEFDVAENFWAPESNLNKDLSFMDKSFSSHSCEYQDSSAGLSSGTILPCDWLIDYQIDDNQEGTHDFFLSSFLEDLPMIAEDSHEIFYLAPNSPPPCNETQSYGHDLSKVSIFSTQDIATNLHGTRPSKYLRTVDFSSSMDWETRGVSSSQIISFNLEKPESSPVKVKLPVMNLHDQKEASNHPTKVTSVEESILQVIGTLMNQMSKKTRINIRDAMYRMEKTTKECTPQNQQKQENVTMYILQESVNHKRALWSEKSKESETNIIDRAVACLVFDNLLLNNPELSTI